MYLYMTEYIYLNSRYSEFNQDTKYHRFNLTKPIIGNLNNISLRLAEAEIPISYYNCISDYNDKLSCKVTITGDVEKNYTTTITQKNYNQSQLVTEINDSFTTQDDTSAEITLRLSFDSQTLKYTLTAKYNGSGSTKILKVEVVSATSLRLLGVTEGLSTGVTDLVESKLEFPNATNLNRTKNIYLFTDVFDTENCNNNNEGQTILSKIQASQKFGDIVSYQNETTDFIKIPQQNTYIDHINIKLLDDDDEFLDFNKLNFCLSLAVQLTPKKKLDYDDENRTPIDTLINMVQQEICEE